jgi:gentisate 1,2-dioxygenase
MTSITHTDNNETKVLMSSLEQTHTKPLWAQMARLNPPFRNPKTIPHLWKYDEIRPLLLKAGKLITEEQAERRVLMLVNPARGLPYSYQISSDVVFN